MATWQDRANRALVLFEASSSDEGDRTFQIFNHVKHAVRMPMGDINAASKSAKIEKFGRLI